MKKIWLAWLVLGAISSSSWAGEGKGFFSNSDLLLQEIFFERVAGIAGSQQPEQVTHHACTITRYCDYPPPTSVSCSSPTGNCVLGAQFVQCDGVTYSCSSCPTPTCPGLSCGSLDGRSCKYAGTCYEAVGCSCRSYTCGCLDGRYICP